MALVGHLESPLEVQLELRKSRHSPLDVTLMSAKLIGLWEEFRQQKQESSKASSLLLNFFDHSLDKLTSGLLLIIRWQH